MRYSRHPLEEQEKAARVVAYIEGYRRAPETAEEVNAAEAAASILLAQEPWS